METLIDVGQHPAANAWRRLRPDAEEPTRIVMLRSRDKGQVYRIEGALSSTSTVIAKHCETETGPVECEIYEDILPRLPITSLRCFGHVREEKGSCWLFLEDAAGVPFSPLRKDQLVIAARWLAALHTTATSLPRAARLPERGAAYYLDQLRYARATIQRGAEDVASCSRHGDREVLERVVAQCDAVEMRWHLIEESCEDMPCTLAHGDFRPKNVHLRTDGDGTRLFAMDWETAGWAVPAADLASLRGPHGDVSALVAYESHVRRCWPEMTLPLLVRAAELGRLFRRLIAIRWSSEMLPHRWEKAIASMRVHDAELSTMSWNGGGR